MSARSILLVGFTGVLAPCSGLKAQAGPARRDSAGVTLVTNRAPRFERRYLVDPTPRTVIGGAGAAEADDLSGQVHLARLSSGRIVVGVQTAGQVRIYDSNGQRLHVAGRKGRGPGEFERITAVTRFAPDTVVVDDGGLRRLTFLTADGRLVRTARLETPSGPGQLVSPLPDGRLLALAPDRPGESVPNAVQRFMSQLVVVDRNGRGTVVGRVPGIEHQVATEMKDGQVTRAYVTRVPFGRRGHWAMVDTLILWAENERFGFSLYNPTGALLRRVDRTYQPAPVTDADLEAHIAQVAASTRGATDQVASVVERLRGIPRRKTKPAFDQLVVRTNGEIWIREYLEPYQRERPGRWSVFAPDGEWLTTVETPIGLEVRWIGDDEIIGVWLDPDDVAEVRAHRIRRP